MVWCGAVHCGVVLCDVVWCVVVWLDGIKRTRVRGRAGLADSWPAGRMSTELVLQLIPSLLPVHTRRPHKKAVYSP